MPRFPIPSNLPNLRPAITFAPPVGAVVSATIRGNDGSTIDIKHEWDGQTLLIHDDNYRTLVNFCPWPGGPPPPNPPLYPRYWSAFGFYIDPGLRTLGFGFQLYAYARKVLAEQGLIIAPSDKATADGVAFWNKIDPGVAWEPEDPALGASRPDLAGRQPPP